MPFKPAKNRLTAICLLLTLGIMPFFGCKAQPVPRLETDDVTLMYLDQEQDRDIQGIALQHPFEITPSVVANHLASIRYERLTLMSGKKRVFNEDQVTRLSGLLSKALNRARPDKFIYFEIEGDGGETTADLFANNGKLHWRILQIDGEQYKVKKWARREAAWKLVPGQGQSYYEKKILFSRKIPNWIVAKARLPEAPQYGKKKKKRSKKKRTARTRSRQAAPPTKSTPAFDELPAPDVSTPASKPSNELERKLGILKTLRDKQLIDDTEYEERRNKLLDEHL